MSDQYVRVPRELLVQWAERFAKAQIFKESSEVHTVLAAGETMTNKPEMASVPRELLERIVRLENSFAEHRQAQHDLVKFLHSAPAEDFRAVVEEPVYQVCNGVSGWIDVDLLRYTACQLDPEEYETRMLFVRPERPVVLPDFNEWYARKVGVLGTESANRDKSVWNACIDEYERLNK